MMMMMNKLSLLFFLISLIPLEVLGKRARRFVNRNSKQTVCYEDLGCFSRLPPFAPTMPLPMSPSKIQTAYYLRTRRNLVVDQQIIPDAANLTASYFDATKPTKIIVHGFVLVNSGLAKWVPEVTETILQQEDVNVIQVNWVKGANVEYDNAASNTRVVGAQVGFLIKMLMETRRAKAEDFHIIGFSLGAHVAGFAGKTIQTGGKKKFVGRITGLDPASPGFNYDSRKVRLDKSDAKFVDVIHTDTQTLLFMSSGMNRNLGHLDFYPNGGADQPGCNEWAKHNSFFSAIADKTVCDHLRAPELFKASINATGNQEHMMAYKCSSYDRFKRGVCLRCRNANSCRRMGYWAKPLTHGKRRARYYSLTSEKAPFTVKHHQVQIHWRKSNQSSTDGFKAKLFLTLHGDAGDTEEIALNDGHAFHVTAGKTTRFLLTNDVTEDIGDLQRVTFRWERPSCRSYFWCKTELVNLKRIKIFDAAKQIRSVFLPLGRNRADRIHSHNIEPGTNFELLRSTYIRQLFPRRRYTSLRREESRVNIIRPSIVSLPLTNPPSAPNSDHNRSRSSSNGSLTTTASSTPTST